MQIAQVTANLLMSELGKRYIVAARSFGHTWRAIRWDKALRNVLAPIILTMAGSFRLMMAELILVEWLFSWPGLGRLLVQTLVPPNLSSVGGMLNTSAFFLNPPLVAGLLTIFSLLFLLADLLASATAKIVDPRLRMVEEEPVHD
jgi:ABC-type dipeptide/oligopeptide/nickel transport system permease component